MREFFIPFSVGLALFLFGLELMRIGLQRIAGERMQAVLTRFTKTPWHGFLTGMLATMLLQSSSAITVLTVGLANSGLLTFPQSVGIILGTNVGTTLTTQIIALDIDHYAVPMLIIGAILWLTPFRPLRFAGLTAGGFACIFLGLETMQTIAGPLKESGVFQEAIGRLHTNPLFPVLFGLAFTTVIQSSTAMTAITMGFVSDGLLPLASGVAVILGGNIGTCLTAWLASLGANRTSKQVAAAHIVLNVLGVLLFFPFIDELAFWCTQLSARPAAQIAHAQTIFNVVCSLVVLPFSSPFARLVKALVPDRNS
ncbi:Na/Pi cotransporter family protein [Bacillaceae bacterium]